MPIGALASAGISLGSALISQFFGNNAAKKQAEEQNQMNYDNWLKQQEYNSPKNQMKRYGEAGLNPQLIYGQGTPGNAPAAPVSQAKPRFAPQIDALSHYQNAVQIQQLQQTVENLKSNQELIQQNEELKRSQQALLDKQTSWYDLLSSSKNQMYGSSMALNKVRQLVGYASVDKMDSDIMRNKQMMNFTGAENIRQESMNAAKISQINSQTGLQNLQKLKVIQETEGLKTKNANLNALLTSVINKNREATISLITGQGNMYAQRTLINTQAALNQLKADGYISEKGLQMLSQIGGLSLKAGQPIKPIKPIKK